MSRGSAALRQTFCAALITTALASCTTEPELPPELFRTEHFRYHAPEDRLVCPRLGEWLEHHLEVVSEFLGADAGGHGPIEIYVVDDASDLPSLCAWPEGTRIRGCYGGGQIFTTRDYDPHELVHAYAAWAGNPPVFFQEGLAEVLECAPWLPEEIEPTADIVDVMPGSSFQELSMEDAAFYRGAAMGFTRYLLDTYGRDRYLALYRALEHDASLTRIREAFVAELGEELDVAVDAWVAAPRRTRRGASLCLAECATPAVGGHDDRVIELACGPRSFLPGRWPWEAYRTLDVPEDGLPYRLRLGPFEGGRMGRVSMRHCDAETDIHPYLGPTVDQPVTDPSREQELWSRLSAGRYWLHVQGGLADAQESADTSHEGHLSVSFEPGLFDPACSADPIEIADANEMVVIGEPLRDAIERPCATCERSVGFSVASSATLDVEPVRTPVSGSEYDADSGLWCVDGTCSEEPTWDELSPARSWLCEDTCDTGCIVSEGFDGAFAYDGLALSPDSTYHLRWTNEPDRETWFVLRAR